MTYDQKFTKHTTVRDIKLQVRMQFCARIQSNKKNKYPPVWLTKNVRHAYKMTV